VVGGAWVPGCLGAWVRGGEGGVGAGGKEQRASLWNESTTSREMTSGQPAWLPTLESSGRYTCQAWARRHGGGLLAWCRARAERHLLAGAVHVRQRAQHELARNDLLPKQDGEL